MQAAPRRLDVALALRQILEVFARDAAPILLLGFGMVSIPVLALAVLPRAGGLGTMLSVAVGLSGLLYVTIVSFGAMTRLVGRPLDPARFAAAGLAASPPGYSVALLLGAGAVIAAIVGLLLPRGGAAGAPLHLLLWAGAAWALVVVLPALPVALAERLSPVAALRRAARLTRGNRGRIVAVLLVVPLLGLLPAATVIGQVVPVFGIGRDSAAMLALGDPRLWLKTGFELVAVALTATVPPVVYMQLAGLARS